MKGSKRAGLCLLLAAVLAFSLSAPACAAAPDSAAADSAAYLYRTVPAPQTGSIGGEWTVLGLARSGREIPQAYWDGYYAALERHVEDCGGVLHPRKHTEYARVILALTALGRDPTHVAGYDLTLPLGDFEKTVWQGINGPIWALIALDSGNYPMPVDPQARVPATRQGYVDEILSRQLTDGGWNLTGTGGDGTADPDVTGMALQALSNYMEQDGVRAAAEKALACLSDRQNESGGFGTGGDSGAESVAQVIVALCALGIDPEDSRFVKGGRTLLDSLMAFRKADGSFSHIPGEDTSLMATEQAFYALVAVERFRAGKPGLYDMRDVSPAPAEGPAVSLSPSLLFGTGVLAAVPAVLASHTGLPLLILLQRDVMTGHET